MSAVQVLKEHYNLDVIELEAALEPTLPDHRLYIYLSNDSKGDMTVAVTYEASDKVERRDDTYVASFAMKITRKSYSIRASTENRLIHLDRFVVCDSLTHPDLFDPIMKKLTALCQPTEITMDDRLGW